MLFNIAADMSILIERANQVARVMSHLVDGGLSILQYTDDTIPFIEHDLEKAMISAFEQMSGLKINFYKSELLYFQEANERPPEYVDLFGCVQCQFLVRCLRISIHY